MRPISAAFDAIDARIPVWVALSDLYLDTDVTLSHDDIARTLAVSPYPIDVLHEMLMYDVHPALYVNLMSVAGEWAGFDQSWLVERMMQTRRQPRWRRRISHWFVRDIGVQWRTLVPMILAARSAAAQP
ncbi:MAG: hypothetical protein ABL934_14160 [Lysobacteraceae bacterium]